MSPTSCQTAPPRDRSVSIADEPVSGQTHEDQLPPAGLNSCSTSSIAFLTPGIAAAGMAKGILHPPGRSNTNPALPSVRPNGVTPRAREAPGQTKHLSPPAATTSE